MTRCLSHDPLWKLSGYGPTSQVEQSLVFLSMGIFAPNGDFRALIRECAREGGHGAAGGVLHGESEHANAE